MLILFYISVPGNFMPNAKLHFPKGADAAALLPCLTAVRNTDFFCVCRLTVVRGRIFRSLPEYWSCFAVIAHRILS